MSEEQSKLMNFLSNNAAPLVRIGPYLLTIILDQIWNRILSDFFRLVVRDHPAFWLQERQVNHASHNRFRSNAGQERRERHFH